MLKCLTDKKICLTFVQELHIILKIEFGGTINMSTVVNHPGETDDK